MANSLDANYEMVYGFEIPTDEVWSLFGDVAAASVSENEIAVPSSLEAAKGIPTGSDELDRMALGVRNSLGELVAYASATIDNDENHATVDCIVVHPSVVQEGIGKWLADEGLHQLDEEDDTQSIDTISFEHFGQVSFLLPYLIQRHGFQYNGLDDEYIRRRPVQPPFVKPTDTSTAPIEVLENTEREADRRPIADIEMAAFRSAVHDLIQASTEYALSNRMLVSSYSEFNFRHAGRSYVVTECREKDNKSWEVIEYDISDLVASSHGIVMATERRYYLTESSEPETYNASCVEKQEVRGEYGAMHPFPILYSDLKEGVFTAARFERIMASLNRLSPKDIVPEPDPTAIDDL